MNIINYQKELDKIIENIKPEEKTPKLLLHSCCAPCSSYVIGYLSEFFDITVFYYNPNIQPEEEYIKRKNEQIRFINLTKTKNKLDFFDVEYEKEAYEQVTLGMENEKEGGVRCTNCFRLRLRKTAIMAKSEGFDYFGTTLTVSPHKDAKRINEIGEKIGNEIGVKWLYSDFKKNEGYKKSIELSKEYGLYRQDYCGCLNSKRKKNIN